MKRIIKVEITNQEAIDAYRKLNDIPEEEKIEIISGFYAGGTIGISNGVLGNQPLTQPVPMPTYIPPSISPQTYC